MIDSAKKDAQAQMEELNLAMEEMREDAFERFEKDTRKAVQRNDEYEGTDDPDLKAVLSEPIEQHMAKRNPCYGDAD